MSLTGHYGGVQIGLAERPGPSRGTINQDKKNKSKSSSSSSSSSSSFFGLLRSSKHHQLKTAQAAASEKEQYLRDFDAQSLASVSTSTTLSPVAKKTTTSPRDDIPAQKWLFAQPDRSTMMPRRSPL